MRCLIGDVCGVCKTCLDEIARLSDETGVAGRGVLPEFPIPADTDQPPTSIFNPENNPGNNPDGYFAELHQPSVGKSNFEVARTTEQRLSDTNRWNWNIRRQNACNVRNCVLSSGHITPHDVLESCPTEGCDRWAGHLIPHSETRSLTYDPSAALLDSIKRINIMVLRAMALHQSINPSTRDKGQIPTISVRHSKSKMHKPAVATPILRQRTTYMQPSLHNDQIRLFSLYPTSQGIQIKGSFRYVHLSTCPPYVALSYTWGDQNVRHGLQTGDRSSITVGQNLWHFLNVQASVITEPTLFWIDAICIDQSNVHERNHQIALMKDIYTKATEVFVWLGEGSNESDLAMDYVSRQAFLKRASKGPGNQPLWPPRVVEALQKLCERQYWRRIWIVQELIHAERVTVWCGEKHFDWRDFEALYHRLKTLEDAGWSPRHVSYMKILQSSAATMIWQRAHFRHPHTPMPHLQTLIEIFQDWQCTDIRDKVFALLSLANMSSPFVSDYDLTPKQLYFAVMKTVDSADFRFANLLSLRLGVAGRDIELYNQSLIEYKSQPSERLVLQARVNHTWETQVLNNKISD